MSDGHIAAMPYAGLFAFRMLQKLAAIVAPIAATTHIFINLFIRVCLSFIRLFVPDVPLGRIAQPF